MELLPGPHRFLWIHTVILVTAGVDRSSNQAAEPVFNINTENVTVISGRTAILRCTVAMKGSHHVVWMNPKKTVITQDEIRITDDTRLSVERIAIQDWDLHIRDVTYDDRGDYTCYINTKPPKKKIVYLDVKVPPRIINISPSKKVIVREGETVELICNATGVPAPTIKWIRKPWGEERDSKQAIMPEGECLLIHNITRYCDGWFECVAFNGIKHAVSQEIEVQVVFQPEVTMTNKRLGQFLGKETILECTISASPFTETVWEKNGEEIQTTSGRYRLEFYNVIDEHHTRKLSLQIFTLQPSDYGRYSCFAKNKYGSDRESMFLIESKKPSRIITTTTTTQQLPVITTRASIYRPMTEIRVTLRPVEKVNYLKHGLSRTTTKSIPNLTISGFVGDVHLVSHCKVFNEALMCPLPQVTIRPLALQHKQSRKVKILKPKSKPGNLHILETSFNM